jgi:LytTr DNA-binding domain
MLRSELLILEEKLQESKSGGQKISVIENFLVSKLNPGRQDLLVLSAMSIIYKSKGNPLSDICCFYILERATFTRTFTDRDYLIDYSLDYIQKVIDPKQFFRINRNCLISIHAVSEIDGYSTSRLKIKLNSPKPIDDLIVSRDKVNEFKTWIGK